MKKLSHLITAAVLNIGLFSTYASSSTIIYDTRDVTDYRGSTP